MGNLSTSLLLLLVALVLLWLAVTDRLGRVLDAYDVLTGKESNPGGLAFNVPAILKQAPTLSLPSLPSLGDVSHVGV